MRPTLPASDARRGADRHRRLVRHHPVAWALGAAALVLLTGLALPGPTFEQRPATAVPDASPPAIAGHAPAQHFQRFALNALLATLMDDDVPARWTDVAVHHFCGPATRIEVDGQPMQPGALVPSKAFTLRWHIDGCWPFDAAMLELSGDVELLVFREDNGLGAVVNAQALRIAGATPSEPTARRFASELALESGAARP